MPLIKRYSNRKLYDSQTRRYVTLDEVRKMIQAGEEVEIVDHQTGENITSSTMAQILFEQEKRIGGLLPQVLLAHMIQLRDSAFQNIQESVRAFLDPVRHTEEEIRRRITLLAQQNLITPEEEQRLSALLLNPALRLTTIANDQSFEAVDVQDLQAILDQIENLEKQIDEIKTKKKP